MLWIDFWTCSPWSLCNMSRPGRVEEMPGGKKQLLYNDLQFGYWYVSKGNNKLFSPLPSKGGEWGGWRVQASVFFCLLSSGLCWLQVWKVLHYLQVVLICHNQLQMIFVQSGIQDQSLGSRSSCSTRQDVSIEYNIDYGKIGSSPEEITLHRLQL